MYKYEIQIQSGVVDNVATAKLTEKLTLQSWLVSRRGILVFHAHLRQISGTSEFAKVFHAFTGHVCLLACVSVNDMLAPTTITE